MRSSTVTSQVLAQLAAGKTVPEVARALGISVIFIQVLAEHLQRAGLAQSAQSLCSSGLGACSSGPLSTEARLACAGCPLA
ncbi:MAG: helix-turn-helix domain-containing protein [Actinomycetaceae bacterium]|nr:helix-turn-helix domain containing protein [Arcanobacterium sp.]MDD7687022.1 helix-turn-helix domain-containing protein [Actinomycetaceae bacterium]MDY5273321.1 helix-turn-helix domain-containing protein [Arcanobacterium sp.]